MTEIDHALAQLAFIQDRVAASTRFRGFAPAAVALTGLLALALAEAQSLWPDAFGAEGTRFVGAWTTAAVIAAGLVGVEALDRSRRFHGRLGSRLVAGTTRLLLPFGAAGAAVTLVLVGRAPATIWLLPGLWQLLIALAGFAAIGTLPRAIVWAAAWYFACGTATLLLAAQAGTPTPWMMGVPFGLGQLLVAAILRQAGQRDG